MANKATPGIFKFVPTPNASAPEIADQLRFAMHELCQREGHINFCWLSIGDGVYLAYDERAPGPR